MESVIDAERLLAACADDGWDDGICIDAELHPLSGPGGLVKPAAYEGNRYQLDERWHSPSDSDPTNVIVIDNVPSQANRLEDALRRNRESLRIPEFQLDLTGLGQLPSHLPTSLSSLQFPHRNADAYLRDSILEGTDFTKTELGKAIFGATAQSCSPLMAWFPQALLFGFWQSHLGPKRHNSKHARSWVSEIIGWAPASTDTRVLGLKGDALNLNTDDPVMFNPDNQSNWDLGPNGAVEGGKKDRLSNIGHGQIPFMRDGDTAAAAVSFRRISQRATVSFAQLRRVSTGLGAEVDAAARALLVALGLQAHRHAFGRGFSLRSGADLRPSATNVKWLGADSDEAIGLGNLEEGQALLNTALERAESAGVPLDGWGRSPVVLQPKANLAKAVRSSWPELPE